MKYHGTFWLATLLAACSPAHIGTLTAAQVTTLEGAVAASAAAKRAATIVVKSGHLSTVQLDRLDTLRAAEEALLFQLEDDQSHGRPLAFDAFNAALLALQKAIPAT